MKLTGILAALLAAMFASQIVLATSHDSDKQRVKPDVQQDSIVYEFIM